MEDLCADLHVMLALAGFGGVADTLRDREYDARVEMQEAGMVVSETESRLPWQPDFDRAPRGKGPKRGEVL